MRRAGHATATGGRQQRAESGGDGAGPIGWTQETAERAEWLPAGCTASVSSKQRVNNKPAGWSRVPADAARAGIAVFTVVAVECGGEGERTGVGSYGCTAEVTRRRLRATGGDGGGVQRQAQRSVSPSSGR